MMTSKQKTKSLINKATSNDRNPTSGYLLNELASKCSTISECQSMEDLLLKKLSKKQPYTKYKALRVIKYLSENGSLHWCRIWQSHKNKLIEAKHFRGVSDPIYGDALNEQVRKAAKEALQSVFEQKQTPYRPTPTFNTYTTIKPTKKKSNLFWYEKPEPKTKTKPKQWAKPTTDRKIITNKRKKSSGKYEKQWVSEIVQSSGIGTKIHNLSKYVKQFENLNQKYILKELNKTLLNSMWQKQAKALVLIEGLMNGKSSDYVINYFNEKMENIQLLQNSNKSVIRRKVNAVNEYLDIEQDIVVDLPPVNTIQNEKWISEQKQTVEIVDLFEIISVNTVVENENENEQDKDDMFSGMNVSQNDITHVMIPVENESVQNNTSGGEILDFFSEKLETTNVPQNVSNGSVFGFDLHGQSVSAFGIDLNNNPPQQFNAQQQYIMPPQPSVSQLNSFDSQYKYMDNTYTLSYNNNDPFAEIMGHGHGGMSVPTIEKYSESQTKKKTVDPFAEFALFGVEPMQS